jgi:glycosyltransferase involved in cell wall biosynthesis
MRIIIATTVVPFVKGGATLLLDWLAEELEVRGHEIEVLRLPFHSAYREMPAQMVGLRLIDVRDRGDRLIALRAPIHLLRHPSKAVWFLHHHRSAFDLMGTNHQDVPDTWEGLGYRELLRAADTASLEEARRLCCNSKVTRDRLRRFNGLEAEVVYPPVHNPSRLRTDDYGDFIFYPCRLTGVKRQWLAIEAMKLTRTPVRLVLTGAPDAPGYLDELRTLVRSEGVEARVDLRGTYVTEVEKEDLFARCLAVAYIAYDEDSYGYPSLEAHHANKAVISARDSGGTDELIIDGENGFICEPEPAALAACFDALWEDRARAERMGRRGAERVHELNITWDHAIERLLA